MKWEYIATGLALIGIGVTLMVALPPPWWPKMPPSLVQFGVFFGLILTLCGAGILIVGAFPNLLLPKPGPIILMFIGMVTLCVGLFWYFQRSIPDTQTSTANLSPEQPEVTLRFVNPKSPALIIANKSNVIAREIKWRVSLWDMDHPDRVNPLPIPAGGFDWIKPGEESDPRDLFQGHSVAQLLKPGTRLMGSAGVSCSTCLRSRSYIVSVDLGKGAWFAEINVKGSGGLPRPEKFTSEALIEYFEALESIPAQSRIPVSEQSDYVVIPEGAK